MHFAHQVQMNAHVWPLETKTWKMAVGRENNEYNDLVFCRFTAIICHVGPVKMSKGSSPNYSFQKSNETERFFILFDFKIHSTIWNDLSVTETFLRVNEYP
jgi:hypothetical protein